MRFVLDTQMFIHYKSFTDCDWKGILGEGSLTLLILQTILGELDEKKYDQRDHIMCSPETLDFIYPSLVHGKEEQNRKANSAKNRIHNPLQNQ